MSRLAATYLTAAAAIAGPVWPRLREPPPPPDPDRLAALRAERSARQARNGQAQRKARA